MNRRIYLALAFIVLLFSQTLAKTPGNIVNKIPLKSHLFDGIPGTNLIGFYKMDGNAQDSTGNNNGTFQGTLTKIANRYGEINKAISFNGTSNFISTDQIYNNPGTVTVSIWFKTNTKKGGALIGFSSNKTSTGGKRDRFIYMQADGKLVAGVAPNSVKQYLTTLSAYNDNKWHLATMTVGNNGFALYVDGDVTNSVASVKSAENYTGYWRIGHDDLDTWPKQPSSFFFDGALDDALIYHRELSTEEVKSLYYPGIASTVVDACSETGKGSIEVTGFGGVPRETGAKYDFSFNGGSYSSTATFNNLAPGKYSINVRDANNRISTESIEVGIQSLFQVSREGIIGYYQMNGNANDEMGINNGTLQNNPTRITDRFGVANSAYNFNGTNQYISTENKYTNPQEFTIAIWFKTGTSGGGKLIGFSGSKTGNSSQYDRQIYMNNAGKLFFGIYNNASLTVNTTQTYNDGEWHYALATLSSAGMRLYVDGILKGSNSANKTAENYSGYWRIGGDNLSGWPDQPATDYFEGTLDDALIYHRALTSEEIDIAYRSLDGAGNSGPVCAGNTLGLTAPAMPGASYSWSGPASFSSALQNPNLTLTNAARGVYNVSVTTITGCVLTAETNVSGINTPGQWTGNISTDWNNASNWCDGLVPTTATDVIISAGSTRMPVINSTANVRNITIATGASLATQGTGTLNISGLLTNNGTMTNLGTTIFNGTTQQTYSGVSTFNHITIDNASGFKLSDSLQAVNVTIQSGSLLANEKDMTITGNWTNNSGPNAFVSGSAKVRLIGTTPQVIGGTQSTTFNTLYANNVGSTITLNQNISIQQTLIAGGVFDLQNFTANRITLGGTLYISATGYLKIGGANTLPSNYTTNTFLLGGTVEYSGSAQIISGQNYGTLILSSSGGSVLKTAGSTQFSTQADFIMRKGAGTAVTLSNISNLDIGRNLLLEAGATLQANASTITVNGNWQNDGTFNGMTGKVILAGASSSVQGTGGQNFNDLSIAGSYVTFSNHSLILTGNFETTGQGVFTQLPGGNLIMTGKNKTIKGTGISIENLTISEIGKVTIHPSLTITGNLNVATATNSLSTIAGSTITMNGADKTISGAGSLSFVNLNISGSVVSSSNVTITGGLNVEGNFSATEGITKFSGSTSLSGIANLYNVTINTGSLQLGSNSILGISNTLAINAGANLDVTSTTPNTVNYNGASNQTVRAVTYHNLIFSNNNTRTAAGAITVNHNLTINAGVTFSSGNYVHTILGNWINNGSFTKSNGTIRFAGTGSSTISGFTDFNILTLDHSSSSSTVILLSDVKTRLLNMTKGTLETGLNKIEITQDRTGPGFIWGNIQRTHAFSNGIRYAFGGPYNSLVFAAPVGINVVTVSVEKGAPLDFPSNSSVNRRYTITSNGTYTSATWQMEYDDNFLNGNAENLLEMWNDRSGGWAQLGVKSNFDLANNFIEQSGLTNLSGTWTLSGLISEFVWTGTTDTDWNKPSNWQTSGVPATRIPDLFDIVHLGSIVFNYQPIISTNVKVKNLVFGNAKAVSLNMASGGELTSGDISGIWTTGKIHTFNTNNQIVNVNGNIRLGAGNSGQAIQLNIGAGTVNVRGWINLPVTSGINFTSTGTLKIGEKIVSDGGSFTAGNGTVEYNGTINQDIAPVTYNHLVVNKILGLAKIQESTTINGNLSVSAGDLINYNYLKVKGDITIIASAKFENKHIVEIGGNWQNAGTYDATGINTLFNGTGTQTISASTFNNLEFNKPVGSRAELTGDVIINGSLVGTSGTLDIKSYHFNRTVLGGSAIMTDNATLIIGSNNAPTLFGNYYMAPQSTIIFDGSATQVLQLPGLVYGNVIFRNSGLKQLTIPITVAGKLSIESGATLKGGFNTLTLLGDWENTGTFIPEAGTVVWKGVTKNITGETVFNNVIVSGEYQVHSNTTFNGLLEVTSTGKTSSLAGVNYLMHGDLTTKGSLNILGEGVFSGNVLQTMSLINAQTIIRIITFNGTVSPKMISTSAPEFGILNVNNTGGVNPSVGWTVKGALNVGPGASFNGGQFAHLVSGNMDNKGIITSSGILDFHPTLSDVSLNFGTQFSSTGLVKLGGTSKTTLSGTPASFRNLTIENTNASGISPTSDWTITNNFDIQPGSILNAGNHQYFLGGDLENDGLINKETSKFIFNGSDDQQISSASAFHHVTINRPSGGATLLTDMKVEGTLHFIKGHISTGHNSVLLSHTASLTNASQETGWINGKLNKLFSSTITSAIFEIGDMQYYTPVDIDVESILTPGGLTISTTSLGHPDISKSTIDSEMSVNRFYTIHTTGLAVSGYQSRFHFATQDVDPGVPLSSLHVAAYNGSSWTNEFSSEYEEPLSVKATGVTWFGDMAIGLICNAETNISYSKPVFCTNELSAPVLNAGTQGGVFSSEAGLNLNSVSGEISPASSNPGKYVVTYFVGATSGCRQFVSRVPVAIGVEGLWTGHISSDWTDINNWSCSIPTYSNDATIPAGMANYPWIQSYVEIKDMTIELDASVKVTGILNLFGTITSDGRIDLTNGKLDMSGSGAQVISGKGFVNKAIDNFEINNVSGVSLSDSLNITGALVFGNQAAKLYTNGHLTLKSTAHETARVGRTMQNNIVGDVTVEHYLSADKAWRLLSIPTNTTQSIKQSWQEGATETGENPHPGYGTQVMSNRSTWKAEGFDVYAGGGASIKTWSNASDNWVGVSSAFNPIETNGGYMIIIRGDRTANAFASPITETKLRTKGSLKMGNQPIISLPAFGYTGIGNPYAAPVDFSKVDKGEGVDDLFYAWDPYIRGNHNMGGYQTISAANDWKPIPGGSHIYSRDVPASVLHSGQAVLIHTTPVASLLPGAHEIQFTEYAKQSLGDINRESKNLQRGQGTKSDKMLLRVTLLAMATSGDIVADGNVAAFSSVYSNGIDGNDALKLLAGGENFGLKRNGKTLAIEARQEVKSIDTLHYYMTNLAKKPYRIHFAPVNMERAGVQAYLLDQFLHTEIPVSLSDTTGIVIDITSNAASSASDRFKLIFRPMAPLAVKITSVKAVLNKNDIDVSWAVGAEEGIEKYEVEKSNDGEHFTKSYSTKAKNRQGSMYAWTDGNTSTGYHYYRIRIVSQNGEVHYSEVVKVFVNKQFSKISVFPNPVINGTINVQFENQPEGKYSLRLFNAIGQLVISKLAEHTGNSTHAVIQLSDKHAKGIYRLEIQNPLGEVQTIQVIHQ